MGWCCSIFTRDFSTNAIQGNKLLTAAETHWLPHWRNPLSFVCLNHEPYTILLWPTSSKPQQFPGVIRQSALPSAPYLKCHLLAFYLISLHLCHGFSSTKHRSESENNNAPDLISFAFSSTGPATKSCAPKLPIKVPVQQGRNININTRETSTFYPGFSKIAHLDLQPYWIHSSSCPECFLFNLVRPTFTGSPYALWWINTWSILTDLAFDFELLLVFISLDINGGLQCTTGKMDTFPVCF